MAEEEKRRHTHHYPSLATREIAYGGQRYLFLCNSTSEALVCEIEGIPAKGVSVEDLFDAQPLSLAGNCRLKRTLGPWATHGICISRAE